MERYLYFATTTAPDSTTSTEEVACFPASKLSHFEMSNATDLKLFFTSEQEADEDSGRNYPVVSLDITSGKHKETIEDIVKAITEPSIAGSNAFVTVADGANSAFCSSHISACASIVVVEAA